MGWVDIDTGGGNGGGGGGGNSEPLTGEVTTVGSVATLSTSAVINKQLLGYTAGAGGDTITSADSIISAMQKLDGNIGALGTGGGGSIDESNLVHKTGDETIGGDKTILGAIYQGDYTGDAYMERRISTFATARTYVTAPNGNVNGGMETHYDTRTGGFRWTHGPSGRGCAWIMYGGATADRLMLGVNGLNFQDYGLCIDIGQYQASTECQFRLGQFNSDPTPGDGGGWLYWNPSTSKIRVYDGSAWADVGGGGGGSSDASTLTGDTLASGVVNSSVKNVGVLDSLAVAGGASFARAGVQNGTAALPAIYFAGTTASGLYADASGHINFVTGTTPRLNIYTTGMVYAPQDLAGGMSVTAGNGAGAVAGSSPTVCLLRLSSKDYGMYLNNTTLGISSQGVAVLSFSRSTRNASFISSILLAPLAEDPAAVQGGQCYYNTTFNKIRVYNGTAWETVTSSA